MKTFEEFLKIRVTVLRARVRDMRAAADLFGPKVSGRLNRAADHHLISETRLLYRDILQGVVRGEIDLTGAKECLSLTDTANHYLAPGDKA